MVYLTCNTFLCVLDASGNESLKYRNGKIGFSVGSSSPYGVDKVIPFFWIFVRIFSGEKSLL